MIHVSELLFELVTDITHTWRSY